MKSYKKQGNELWVCLFHIVEIKIAELTCLLESRFCNENTMRSLAAALHCPHNGRLLGYRERKGKHGGIISRKSENYISFDDIPNTNSSNSLVDSSGVLSMYLMLVDTSGNYIFGVAYNLWVFWIQWEGLDTKDNGFFLSCHVPLRLWSQI